MHISVIRTGNGLSSLSDTQHSYLSHFWRKEAGMQTLKLIGQATLTGLVIGVVVGLVANFMEIDQAAAISGGISGAVTAIITIILTKRSS
tara:strand:- start:258 stop:527 length:270 start_codon:yes stop_codon:yes gene_type:complete